MEEDIYLKKLAQRNIKPTGHAVAYPSRHDAV